MKDHHNYSNGNYVEINPQLSPLHQSYWPKIMQKDLLCKKCGWRNNVVCYRGIRKSSSALITLFEDQYVLSFKLINRAAGFKDIQFKNNQIKPNWWAIVLLHTLLDKYIKFSAMTYQSNLRTQNIWTTL